MITNTANLGRTILQVGEFQRNGMHIQKISYPIYCTKVLHFQNITGKKSQGPMSIRSQELWVWQSLNCIMCTMWHYLLYIGIIKILNHLIIPKNQHKEAESKRWCRSHVYLSSQKYSSWTNCFMIVEA